jgi:hypothetical protein
MIGRRTSGFEVSSLLVGGRRGNIFLAANPESGHRAAVRYLLADDVGSGFEEFSREVAMALQLPHNPEVVSRVLDDGREVLVALIDAAAPGTGATRFPQTTQLERIAAQPPARRSLWWFALPIAVLLAGVGLWRRQQPEVTAPTEPVVPVVVRAEPKAEIAVPLEVAQPEVTPVPDAGPIVAPVPVAVPVARPKPPCEVTDEWRRNRSADLNEVQNRVATSEKLSQELQGTLDRFSVALRDARNDDDCRAIEARLKVLVRRVFPRP